MKKEYRSRVYMDRPDYADFDPPEKFQAVTSIIARRLREHPQAICSYSGGADSDILIDLIERTRAAFDLPPVKYAFFNTGLEMKATRNHVKSTAEKYKVEITEYRPEINIVWGSVCFKDYVCRAVRLAGERDSAVYCTGIRGSGGQGREEEGAERALSEKRKRH